MPLHTKNATNFEPADFFYKLFKCARVPSCLVARDAMTISSEDV